MTPQLDLSFVRHPLAGTRLVRRRAAWPFALTQGFRLDGDAAGRLTVIVQSAGGAVLGGDRIALRLAFAEGAGATVATQAAMAVHAAGAGGVAEERTVIAVSEGALAEWLPAPRILFPGADLAQSLTLAVADGGVAIVADGFATHDPAGAGRPFARYASAFALTRPDGATLAAEAAVLEGPPGAFGAAARLTAHGMLTVACPGDAAAHAALAAAMEAAAGGEVLAAASPLPHGAGATLRIAATDGARLHRATLAARAAARRLLTGADPPARPG